MRSYLYSGESSVQPFRQSAACVAVLKLAFFAGYVLGGERVGELPARGGSRGAEEQKAGQEKALRGS